MDQPTEQEFQAQPKVPADDRPPQAAPDRAEPVLAPAAASTVAVATADCGCDTAPLTAESGGPETANAYVYVLGQIDFLFPSLAVEKEVAQAVARSQSAELTDRQALCAVISQPENRYLARQLCYVLSVQGIETYILRPRDPVEFDRLVEAIRPEPKGADLDVVIGHRGPLAPPSLCNGLTIPVVNFEQIYCFTSDELVAAIGQPQGMSDEQFGASSHELLRRVMQLADNAGDTDEHRAINYLAVRYPRIYEKTVEAFAADSSLSGVSFHESRLSGARRIIDVVLCYTHRRTDVSEKFFVRVDVTEPFPFLVNKLCPYYDR
ncbi:hypothetical protein [Kitasatospora sp. A2-31]|uniref:cyanobactin maturation protease PatG family protein n=1 Tax=Kitasatospora sp. A2-31 TaxID=2916414 RepID=UPI001EEDA629|nr:hypothetical protein [Kitasatospora sp. A2-31]MCG6499340.1 hypothetical protein [Kitasatospora sp. A2-31]